MATVMEKDILFRSGGACLTKYGVPWYRRRWDKDEAEAYTFTRADASTCATYVDQGLLIRNAVAGKLRGDWTGSSLGLLLEDTRTNLCLQSEDFATTWSAVGTPVITTNAATCGVLTLDLIRDDNGAAIEGYTQSFATGIVATGLNALSFFVAVGSTVPATYTDIALYDTTAAANRFRASITWSGTVAVVTCSLGTLLSSIALGGGVYRILLQTSTCLVANGHQIEVYPAGGSAADVGGVYVGGVQLENAPYPSSYIKTTAATIARTADLLTFPIGFGPQTVTVYARVPRPAHADALGNFGAQPTLVRISSGSGMIELVANAATRQWDANLVDADGATKGAVAAFPAGSTLEACVQYDACDTAPRVRLDVGSGFGSWSATGSAFTTWGGAAILNLGTLAGNCWDGGIEQLMIARGAFTLAEMQTWAAL